MEEIGKMSKYRYGEVKNYIHNEFINVYRKGL